MEANEPRADDSYIIRLQRVTRNHKILKWFVLANAAFLFICCIMLLSYSLWSLYQLDRAMRSRDEAVHLTRYFGRYQVADAASSPENDSVVIEDFHDWRRSILQSLEELKGKGASKASESYNLTFLLHSIADTVKNFIDNDGRSGNLTAVLRNKLIVTNLTDFEIHILKEFTKLKILEQSGGAKFRFRRTVRGGPDESQCNVEFAFGDGKRPLRVEVKPVKSGEGMINVKTVINNVGWGKNDSDVRECSFNIVYKPSTE